MFRIEIGSGSLTLQCFFFPPSGRPEVPKVQAMQDTINT